MKEVRRKIPFSWDNEIHVSLTLKELAAIYATAAETPTKVVQQYADATLPRKLDVIENDLPYRIYVDLKAILIDNGILSEEE